MNTLKIATIFTSLMNAKACVVWPLWLDPKDGLVRCLGAVSYRRPDDLKYEESVFVPEMAYDKSHPFAFSAFGGLREKNQTIYDCAVAEVDEETAYLGIPNLRSKLESAPYLCRDLNGKITDTYDPTEQYASIVFFVRLDDIENLADRCTQAAKMEYARVPTKEYPEEVLQLRKRRIESMMYLECKFFEIIDCVSSGILPVFELGSREIVNPSGFPEAARRVMLTPDVKAVPLMPRTALTLKVGAPYILKILNNLFNFENDENDENDDE